MATNLHEPLAFFITWTVYGTHLQGDVRGWRRRKAGEQLPQPRLDQWRRERLKFPIALLAAEHRRVVEDEITRLCTVRGWSLWSCNARTNHVHVAVTAAGLAGGKVRDQRKANCTRALREAFPVWLDRPVWTVGGDWRCVNTESELARVVTYVADGQDRKGASGDPSAAGR